MRVTILHPRLDCSFKPGPVPKLGATVAIEPIRVHWRNFLMELKDEHKRRGDSVVVIHKPLWQFTIDDIIKSKAQRVYIPHKTRDNFPVDIKYGPRYYMQTVFPWLFTVDKWGWGASMKHKVRWKNGFRDSPIFTILQKRIEENASKFAQPDRKELPWDDFLFFACQLPHDETIKYHSDYEVADALRAVCEWATDTNKELVVKRHPLNPGSQAGLHEIVKRFPKVHWTTDHSIHDLLNGCRAAFCVNSGVGIESLLHEKPVFTFGRSEYDDVAIRVNNLNVAAAWRRKKNFSAEKAHAWLDSYVNFCYDTTDSKNFSRLS